MKGRGGYSGQPHDRKNARAIDARAAPWATIEEHIVGAVVLAARLFGAMWPARKRGVAGQPSAKLKSEND